MVRTSKGLFSKRRRNESILLVMLLTFRCAILSPRLLGKPCNVTKILRILRDIGRFGVSADVSS